MWKQMAVMAAAGMMAGAAGAQSYALVEGTQEIQIQGLWEQDHPNGDVVSFDIGYGYFLRDGFQLGPTFGFYSSERLDYWRIGLRAEQHYDVRAPFIPYLGGGVGYQDINTSEDKDAVYADIALGVKFMMIQDLALDLALHNMLATEDIYRSDDEDGYDSHKMLLSLGLRFYY